GGREPTPGGLPGARGADLAALQSLVRDHQAHVWAIPFHPKRNRGNGRDVDQEAFVKAFRSLGSFRGDAKFSSWLLRITHNCAIDAFRKARREGPVPDDVLAGLAVERPQGSAEDRLRIAQAVRLLASELRGPFVVIEVLG